MTHNKLYVWREIAPESFYGNDMLVVMAPTLAQARKKAYAYVTDIFSGHGDLLIIQANINVKQPEVGETLAFCRYYE